jgi:hypothetical protein
MSSEPDDYCREGIHRPGHLQKAFPALHGWAAWPYEQGVLRVVGDRWDITVG